MLECVNGNVSCGCVSYLSDHVCWSVLVFGNVSCGCVSYLSDHVCWSVLMVTCRVVASHICLIMCVGVC